MKKAKISAIVVPNPVPLPLTGRSLIRQDLSLRGMCHSKVQATDYIFTAYSIG